MGSRLEANSSAVRKRIEKHTFDDENGDEYEGSKFGGYADYFRRKRIKLQNLDAERRSSNNTGLPPIFRGVLAHVNGYTQPSLGDLHAMIVDHGGGFMQYLDGKTTVTHIIAGTLTPKKKIEFRKYRIVKPAWVVDSIKAGKLLPWDKYKVIDEGASQHVLAFENGKIASQISSEQGGYRDQTHASWYIEQVKDVARALEQRPFDADDEYISAAGLQLPQHERYLKSDQIDSSRPKSENFSSISTETPSDVSRLGSAEPGIVDENEYQCEDTLSDGMIWQSEDDSTEQNHVITAGTPNLAEGEGSKITSAIPQVTSRSPSKDTPLTAEEHNAILLKNPRIWKSTVANPGFLKQYYEESRLHHLSTWKAELKSQLQALANERTPSQRERQQRPPGMSQYILHVDFDCFFAAVSLKRRPEYANNPTVVAHGSGPGSEIASCNYIARKFGVRNGMWMKTALQICPDIKVLPYDFKLYEDVSREFYTAVIDTGGLVQSVSIDEALLDVSLLCSVTGAHHGQDDSDSLILREQAKADEIAQNLRDRIKLITGCDVSVGIGGNILLAKVALRKAKPAGQYHIKPNEVLEFIGGLAVQDLPGVAHSIGGKLEELGIKLVKDVREIPKERLIVTLGPKTGQKIWDYSKGIDRTEVGDHVPRKSVSAEVNWGIRFVSQAQADEFVQSLCEELHKRLVNEGVKGHQLTLKLMRRAADTPIEPPKHLGHGKCDIFNKSVVLGVATNATEILGREAISIMHGWGFPPGELRGIGAQVTKLEPIKGSRESPAKSSQKRLQFKKNANISPSIDLIIDNVESPQKPMAPIVHPAAAITALNQSESDSHVLLNTLGTQFIMPTQVDPEVLAELPADIRSKFLPRSKLVLAAPQPAAAKESKPHSTPSTMLPDTLPSFSQLDQETLEALPADVRAEVLGFYHQSPKKPQNQTVLPQSPHKNRIIKQKNKTQTTPTKKRPDLLSRGGPSKILDSRSTLTQSNFIITGPTRDNSHHPKTGSDQLKIDEIAPDFLDALPEDIRREVLAQHRRDRLQKSSGLDLKSKQRHPPPPDHPPVGQRRLRIPPRPPRPTFTAQKFSSLPDLRTAISAWYDAFSDEEPNEEDVEALVVYLRRVVLEESDMAKAVSVVKWLAWVVDQGGGGEWWDNAVTMVQEGIQRAVGERGLGRIDFYS